jgi:hypothetical protein
LEIQQQKPTKYLNLHLEKELSAVLAYMYDVLDLKNSTEDDTSPGHPLIMMHTSKINIFVCDKIHSDNQVVYLDILKHLRDGIQWK